MSHTKTVKKGFASIELLLVLILVAVVGFGAYYFGKNRTNLSALDASPKPTLISSSIPAEESEAWTVHNEGSFEMSLPKEWYKTSSSNPLQYLNYQLSTTGGGGFDETVDSGKLKVEVYSQNWEGTLSEYINNRKVQEKDLRGPESQWYSENKMIDGLPAVKVKTNNFGYVYYVKPNNSDTVYSFSFLLDFDNYTSLADEIIATVSFN